VRFGTKRALRVAAASHVATMMLMISVGLIVGLIWPYWLGLILMALLFIYEHSLINPDDLSKLSIAFFNVNGYISVVVFVATFSAVLLGS
jgi:4-hydroxybenzoate polyprenyltransferase